MLSVDLWAPVCAALAILLQAGELRKAQSKTVLFGGAALPVIIAFIANSYIINFSIMQVHQFLAEFGPLIGLIFLVEALTLFRRRVKWPVPPLGSVAALIYLQMYFYQSGWLNWDFQYMAATFGCLTGAALVLVSYLFDEFPAFAQTVVASQFLVIAIAFAALPSSSTKVVLVSWEETLISALTLLVFVVAGFLFGGFRQKLNKKRVT